jgi:hypothetical protein
MRADDPEVFRVVLILVTYGGSRSAALLRMAGGVDTRHHRPSAICCSFMGCYGLLAT